MEKNMQYHRYHKYVDVLVHETNFQRCVIIVQETYACSVTFFLHHRFDWLKWCYFVLDVACVLWLVAFNNGLLPVFNDTIALTCTRFKDENPCYTNKKVVFLLGTLNLCQHGTSFLINEPQLHPCISTSRWIIQ